MKMNILYIILPIIFVLLFSYTVEGFDYSDQTEENIIISDNWCNCNKTCNLVNVGEDGKAGEAGVKNLEDTCDINYNFIDDLEKTDDKKQDLIKYCEGCLDILNKRCRRGKYNKIEDPIMDVDAWCGRAKLRKYTGRGVLERCRNTTGYSKDQMLDQLIEYMGYGYGPQLALPCPANLNPYQRWPRQGRYGPGGERHDEYGLKES